MLVASNEDPGRKGMPGGFLSLSWDGRNTNTAIVWGLFPPFKNGNLRRVEGELVAYDASNFDPQLNFSRLKSLWRSRQDPADRFSLPKFCCPTVADGKVFVAAGDGSVLSIYGLRAGGGGYDLSRDAQHASFGGPEGLRLNGSAEVDVGKKIALTRNPIEDDLVGQAFVPTFHAGSVFAIDPVDVTDLKTTFTVRLGFIDPDQIADGFTFTIQAVGPVRSEAPAADLVMRLTRSTRQGRARASRAASRSRSTWSTTPSASGGMASKEAHGRTTLARTGWR